MVWVKITPDMASLKYGSYVTKHCLIMFRERSTWLGLGKKTTWLGFRKNHGLG